MSTGNNNQFCACSADASMCCPACAVPAISYIRRVAQCTSSHHNLVGLIGFQAFQDLCSDALFLQILDSANMRPHPIQKNVVKRWPDQHCGSGLQPQPIMEVLTIGDVFGVSGECGDVF